MIETKGYKITPINGDLAVSRNAEIGGDVDVHGKARVAGSLKVEGFLDAPHIKGAAKGLFNSVEELAKEYPNPRPGWFAIVLDATDKEKGILYKAENWGWVATTDEARPYQFIKDSINVFASKGELGDLENKVTVNADDIHNLKRGMDFRLLDDAVDLILYQGPDDSPILLAFLPSASELLAGVMSAEDKRNLNNSTVKVITWSNDTDPSNMNDFTIAGVYNIEGERTRDNDNLPILNTGGGHSFNARLTVLDSSISGSGKDDDKCITQVLSFSNRLGQGEVYIRTGKGSSLDNLTWDKWSTLQRNVNVGSLNSKGDLRNYIDNGIYSGVFRYGSSINDLRTFVMVVINDYAIGLSPRRVSQFLYSIDKATGKVSYEVQTCEDETWKGWEILNKGEIDSMISVAVDNAIKGIIADAPEAFDTLKEIADWIANNETGAVALANAISANTDAITAERTRAIGQENLLNNAIADEKSRAEQAEEALGKTIADEATRAIEAENKIANTIAEESKATDEKIVKEKTRAEAVEQTLADDIANAPNLALRALFVAAGAEYNDTNANKAKTAPWGETVTHKAGHYYLNGLGDITEEQMAVIYSKGNTLNLAYNLCSYKGRTNLSLLSIGTTTVLDSYHYATQCSAEVINLDKGGGSIVSIDSTYKSELSFGLCYKLKAICGKLRFGQAPNDKVFYNSKLLQYVSIISLKHNISFGTNSIISKESILYMIQNATPESAITITLHADAYARLANDADIVAALEAQPLITLVSA